MTRPAIARSSTTSPGEEMKNRSVFTVRPVALGGAWPLKIAKMSDTQGGSG
jgi:hypothetical protein